MCSFSFPVVFGLFFIFHWGPEQTKNPTGQKSLSVLEPSDVIRNFGAECQYFFLLFFRNETDDARLNDRPSS